MIVSVSIDTEQRSACPDSYSMQPVIGNLNTEAEIDYYVRAVVGCTPLIAAYIF